MGRAKKYRINYHSEFELDLAPLLAVMVKLVPVLLISSAFVQVMVIETELPQFVKQAIEEQNKHPSIDLRLSVDAKTGFHILVKDNAKESSQDIPLKDGEFDFSALHTQLVALKKSYPDIFKMEMIPGEDIAYKDIIKTMDEARRSRSGERFPVTDKATQKVSETDFMFPEIIFGNAVEG